MKFIKKISIFVAVILLTGVYTSTVFAAGSFKWGPVTVSSDGKTLGTALTYVPADGKPINTTTVTLGGKNTTTGDNISADTMTSVVENGRTVTKSFSNIVMGSSTFIVSRDISKMFPGKNTNSLVYFQSSGDVLPNQSYSVKVSVDTRGVYTIIDSKTGNILYPVSQKTSTSSTSGNVNNATTGLNDSNASTSLNNSNASTVLNNGSNSNAGVSSVKLKNPLKSDLDSIPKIINAILDNIVIPIAVPIFILALIYTGILYVIARGKPEKLNEAHNALKWTLIGGAVILGSKLISSAIAGTLAAITGTVVK